MAEILNEFVNTREDFQRIFELQKKSSISFRHEPLKNRKDRLRKLRSWVLSNQGRVMEAVQQDLGKPVEEVMLSELRPVIAEIRQALTNLNSWAGPHYVDTPFSYIGTRSYIKYEPKGVTLIMSPWNFPFNLAISPLVASLAAGNTAIVKPSEKSPHTSALIASMVQEIFDESEVKVFNGDAEIAKGLLKLPFDHRFFTGSSAIGKEVMKAAANHLSGLTLELGGKSPVIIDSTVDIKDASEKLVWGKYLNCGQTCIAPDYVLVEDSVADPLIARMKEDVARLFGRGKSEYEQSPDYGRIIDEGHHRRLITLLDDAVSKGAKIITGGKFKPETKFFEPTILDYVDSNSRLMQEEIFGPLLPILRVKDLDQAINLINDKPKPLALYIFSSKSSHIRKILEATSSGSTVIVDCVLQFSHPDLPFGGINNSGFGKSHGFYGFKQFSNEKPVLKQRTGFTAPKLLYPPYTGFMRKWIKFVTRYL